MAQDFKSPPTVMLLKDSKEARIKKQGDTLGCHYSNTTVDSVEVLRFDQILDTVRFQIHLKERDMEM